MLESKNEELEITAVCKESEITQKITEIENIQASNQFLAATQKLMQQEIETLKSRTATASFDNDGCSNNFLDAASSAVPLVRLKSSEHQDVLDELLPQSSTTFSLPRRIIGNKFSFVDSASSSSSIANPFTTHGASAIVFSNDDDDDQSGYNMSPKDRAFANFRSETESGNSELVFSPLPKRARRDSSTTTSAQTLESFDEYLSKSVSSWPAAVITPMSSCISPSSSAATDSSVVGPTTYPIIDLTDSVVAETPSNSSPVIDLTDPFVSGSTDCDIESTGSFVAPDFTDCSSTNSFHNSTDSSTISSGNSTNSFVSSTDSFVSSTDSTVSVSCSTESSVGLTDPLDDRLLTFVGVL